MTAVSRTAPSPGTVLHLAPHPDDELIGAPAALMAMRDAGWRIVNLAVSLGAKDQKERREKELREACARAGFELQIADVPLRGPYTGPPGQLDEEEAARAETAVTDAVASAVAVEKPRLVVAPSPHDRHPGHEIVGRAAVTVCERLEEPPPLWLWGLWANLPFPTIAVSFGEDRMKEILRCLEAHAGELTRNDFRRLVRGRAEMNASLGPELVFGFGTEARAERGGQNVELLCEVVLTEREWRLGSPRWLDGAEPLGAHRSSEGALLSGWLRSPSAASLYGT